MNRAIVVVATVSMSRGALALLALVACTPRPTPEQVQALIDAELRRGLVAAVEATLAEDQANRVALQLDNDERFRHFIPEETRPHEVTTFLRRAHVRVSVKDLKALDVVAGADVFGLVLHYGAGTLEIQDRTGTDDDRHAALLGIHDDLWQRAWQVAQPGVERALAPLPEEDRGQRLAAIEAMPVRWERRLRERLPDHGTLRREALGAAWGKRHDQPLDQVYFDGRLALAKAEVLRAFGDPGGRGSRIFLSGPLSGLVLARGDTIRAEVDGPRGLTVSFVARGELAKGLLDDTMASVRPYDLGPGGGNELRNSLSGMADPLRICLTRISILHQAPSADAARELLRALAPVTRTELRPVTHGLAAWLKLDDPAALVATPP